MRKAFLVCILSVLLTGCAADTKDRDGMGEPPPISTAPAAPVSETGQFKLTVTVFRKDPPIGVRVEQARVTVKDLEVFTNGQGITVPLNFVLPDHTRFPYVIQVDKEGYKTCIVEFGSYVFSNSKDWWKLGQDLYPLFIWLPDGEGMITGDECHGGRTQPQSPGPNG